MKKIKILLLLILFLATLPKVQAAEIIFFEFAQETAGFIKIAETETASQLFQPNSETLTGFDVWLDNAGAASSTTFELFDAEDNLLVKKTLTVPTIPLTWGGRRFHVAFSHTLTISPTAIYKIKITSTLPKLRLFYSQKIQLLPSNQPFPTDQTTLKAAYLGTAEQDFVFKLALYQYTEETLPLIIPLPTPTPPEATSSNPANPSLPTSSEILPPTILNPTPFPPENSSSTNLVPVNIEIKETNQGELSLTIQWSAPPQGEPGQGYRVDIFNQNNELQKQIFVPSGQHQIVVNDLPPGKYFVIIYANYNYLFQRIAEITVNLAAPPSAPARPLIIYFIIMALFLISAAIIIFIILRKKLVKKNSGFTLIEFLIGSAILIGIVLVAALTIQFVCRQATGILPTADLITQQKLQETLRNMIPELQAMKPSNIGTYPIESVSSTALTFYSDLDKDGLAERIRYFASSTIFKKGIIKPTGNPLSYNLANEKISTVVPEILTASSTIFSYYDQNFTGSEAPLSPPIDVNSIRTLKVGVTIKAGYFFIQVTPRNLR